MPLVIRESGREKTDVTHSMAGRCSMYGSARMPQDACDRVYLSIMCELWLELRMNGQCGWRDKSPGTREPTHWVSLGHRIGILSRGAGSS